MERHPTSCASAAASAAQDSTEIARISRAKRSAGCACSAAAVLARTACISDSHVPSVGIRRSAVSLSTSVLKATLSCMFKNCVDNT